MMTYTKYIQQFLTILIMIAQLNLDELRRARTCTKYSKQINIIADGTKNYSSSIFFFVNTLNQFIHCLFSLNSNMFSSFLILLHSSVSYCIFQGSIRSRNYFLATLKASMSSLATAIFKLPLACFYISCATNRFF